QKEVIAPIIAPHPVSNNQIQKEVIAPIIAPHPVSNNQGQKKLILPVPVSVELQVLRLDEISTLLDGFSGTVQLKTTWKDPSLAFDKKQEGVSRIILDDEKALEKLKKIWSPNLKIKNMKKLPQKEHHGLIISTDGAVEYIFLVAGEFQVPLDTKNFPFDSQILVLDIESAKYTISHMRIIYEEEQQYNSGVATETITSLWHLCDFHTKIQTHRGWDGYSFENLRFMVKMERASAPYIPFIFFPFFLIMIFPCMLLLTDSINNTSKITILLSSLIALITLQFTITLKYPDSSAVGSLLLKVFGIGYIFLLIIVIFTCFFEKRVFSSVYSNSAIKTISEYFKWSLPLLACLILAGYAVDAIK
ncbi:MAG: hypothetical protein WCK82_14825, partial [Bacteroidota bacterium]